MDTTALDIVFDSQGVCNYCADFVARLGHILHEDEERKRVRMAQLVARCKHRGRNLDYDCVIGVSGGVDSSWVLVQAIELGLRPLAVHMDNGWNSELAQNNIANLVRGLGVDLYTHVIEWTEYRSLMQAFFDADVIDVELLYDNAMLAVNFQQAAKFGVNYIMAGSNSSSEGMTMPRKWHAFKFDKCNIRAIARRAGIRALRTFPSVGTIERAYFELVKRVGWVSFLDYIPYNKFDAMTQLAARFQYKPYPYKHYESIFTRFYQGHILPTKFNVDKRRLHFSTLIMSGQLDRESSLHDLRSPPYPDENSRRSDEEYFLKKMQWSSAQLREYLNRPRVEHETYGSEERFYTRLRRIYGALAGGARG